jgi:hypothetical protein
VADQPFQCPQPPFNGSRAPWNALVGKGIRLGEPQDSLWLRNPYPQFLAELLGSLRSTGDEHQGPSQVVMERCCHVGPSRRQNVK